MKKQILTIVILFLTLLTSAQKTVGNIKLDAKLVVEGQNLVLNGAGVREKFFMDMYVGSLYVTKKSSDGATISAANEPMAIKLNMVSGLITASKMATAIEEGFMKTTGNKTSAYKSKIEKFKSFFKEKINKKDIFIIVYVPNDGVSVYKNGIKKGTIEGYEFKKVLFGIWLGATPADADLKAGMLNKN